MNMLTYGDLFKHLAKKCDFRKRKSDGEITWNCDGNLTFTEEFCKDNFLDFGRVRAFLELHSGYCDCEVLFNVEEHVDPSMSIERLN